MFSWSNHDPLNPSGQDPLRHFTVARPFTFKYPGQVEASDLHGGVPAVRSTLEEQVDQAFAGVSGRPATNDE